MRRQIVTEVIGAGALGAELMFLTEHLQQEGCEYCEVLFGFAWGNAYYPGNKWDFARLPVAALIEEVARVEAAEMGSLGDDDLFVLLPDSGVEFQFCHESDIHLSCKSPGRISEFFVRRWSDRGFRPREWEMTEDGKRSRLLGSVDETQQGAPAADQVPG
jgi:hypothetical protein